MKEALIEIAPPPSGSVLRSGRRTYLYIVLAGILLFCCVHGCIAAVYNPFTDHRLMSLFLILHHYPVYIDPASGPAMSTLYPPLSVLLYAPAAAFHSPLTCFSVAGLIAQVLWLAPLLMALCLVERSGSRVFEAWLLATTFVMWCSVSKILQTLYLVHADDPAIFLSAAGIIAFIANRRRSRVWMIVASAVFCALAIWAKQTVFPAACVPVLLLLVNREFRRLLIFLAATACTHLIALAVWSRIFDLRLMFTWLIKIPAHHPWKDTLLGSFANANDVLMSENFFVLMALALALICAVSEFGKVDRFLVRTLSSEPWFVFALTGLALWPASALGYCKIGGTENTLLYSTYFLTAALVLWAYTALVDFRRIAAAVLSAAFVFLLVSTSLMSPRWIREMDPRALSRAHSIEAYNFDRKWPGEVFFPWYPLAVYFAGGKIYNSDLGVWDRLLAGVQVSKASYLAHLPPNMKYVAYTPDSYQFALAPIPEYNVRVTDPRLPGWILYARK